jgi:rhombotail lipoprotein
MDLAVVDPATRSLVLRAGGTDGSHEHSTMVDAQRDARLAGAKSFDSASTQMIANFDAALNSFEASVHEGRANVRVVNRNGTPTGGSGGGGEVSLLDAALLFLLAAAGRFKGRAFRRAPAWALRCSVTNASRR